jgi:CRISPR/Cas system CMR subunit Cmr4 (Cas7 group RAMP superfamily)
MSDQIKIFEIEKEIQNILQNNQNMDGLNHKVFVEPYHKDNHYPQIQIFRTNVFFEDISISRQRRLTAVFNIWPMVTGMQNDENLNVKLENMVNRIIRTLSNHITINSKVLTSRVTGLEFSASEATHARGLLLMAKIIFEITNSFNAKPVQI